MSGTVMVSVDDLRALCDLVCDRDCSKEVTPANIDQCHELIIKMAGHHADEIYAPDDGSEVKDAPIVWRGEVESILYKAGQILVRSTDDGEVPQVFEAGQIVNITVVPTEEDRTGG